MNIAIVSVLLRSFVAPFQEELIHSYDNALDKLIAVRNEASDQGNEEIVEICDWIESKHLEQTFFPDAPQIGEEQ